MHQSDSFIDEVSEEVRRDSLYRLLRRYGWLLAALVVIAVGTAAGLEWRKASARGDAEQHGDALRRIAEEADPARRAEDYAALAASAAVVAPVARLNQAAAEIQAGKPDAAAATLAALADDPAAPELYRDLAALQRVMLLGSTMDAGERRATIEALAGLDAPFRPLALEQRALMSLETGDKAAAIADLSVILSLPTTPEQLATRARQLIVAAGGTLPGAGPAPAPAAPASGG
ncbi:MAG: hypothetical protein U1E34_12840 [Amaricoccus sp.]